MRNGDAAQIQVVGLNPPSTGTRPCRTLDVICSRIAILSGAATLMVSRQTLRLFATSTASSVTSNWLPSVKKCPVTMEVTPISRPACCKSKFGPLYLLVVANGRIENDGT